jgi:hypothetical protein
VLETIRCQKEVGRIEALPGGSCHHPDILEGLQGSKRVRCNHEEDRQGSSSCQDAIGSCSVSDSQKIGCSGASSLEKTSRTEVLSEDRQSSCHTANSHSQVIYSFVFQHKSLLAIDLFNFLGLKFYIFYFIGFLS